MEDHHIVGIHITDRIEHAPDVQQVLTEYGCNIKTRIGLHHVDDRFCSPRGLILLELFGDAATCRAMVDRLEQIQGVDTKEMIFEH